MDYLLYARIIASVLFVIALYLFRKHRRNVHFTQVMLFSLALFLSLLASFVDVLIPSILQFIALAAVAYSAYLYNQRGILRRRKQLLDILEKPTTPFGKELHKTVFYPELKNIESEKLKLEKENKKLSELKESYEQKMEQLKSESKDFKLEKKDLAKERDSVMKMQDSLSKERKVLQDLKEKLDEKEEELVGREDKVANGLEEIETHKKNISATSKELEKS
ncbi:MAG: hypothetical protein Q8L34_03800, partial [Candidatus Woesearchaeota archaeon]|nr:hypothetical protein [Candidatus Woesearchaeota archaeon]